MNKEQWDEEALENLFKQAPKVTDHRTKEEVFQRLVDEGSFNEQPPQPQKVVKKGVRWTPLVASIASLFILVVIGSQFLNDNSISMQNSARDEAKVETTSGTMEAESRDAATERAMPSSFSLIAAQQTLVYASQTEGLTLFEMGLADGAQIVPVSFLIPNDLVAERTGTEKPTKLQLYETFASTIDETVLGFSEFHPFKGILREAGDTLIHTLPEGHNYDAGSAAIVNYVAALADTFGDAYKEVRLEDANGETIFFDHIGNMLEPVTLQGPDRQYNYFAYQKQDGSFYLSPNFHMGYSDVTEAFQNMTAEVNDIYQTVILPDVTFSVEEGHDFVTITFDQPLDLEQYDPAQAMRMIEGMLLTAASFDKQIKFEQIVQETWSGFDFTNPLEKPIAANIVFYNF